MSDFYGTGNNALDKVSPLAGLRWINGFYYSNDNRFDNSPYWKTTAKIPCYPGDSISVVSALAQTNRWVMVFFDKANTFLSGMNQLGNDYAESVTITVPDGAYYFRVSTLTARLSETKIVYGTGGQQTPIFNVARMVYVLDTYVHSDLDYAYVDPSGTDGIGTKNSPFNSLLSAFNAGYTKIKAKKGVYNANFQLHFQSKKEVSLELWSENTEFSDDVPIKEKITLFYGAILTANTSSTSFSIPYTPQTGRRFEKVFITGTLPPIDASFEYSEAYNANFFLWKPGHKARRYKPVLPTAYTGEEGTFTYRNGNIEGVFYQTDQNISGLNMYVTDDNANPIVCTDCGSVHIDGVAFLGQWYGGIKMTRVNKATFSDCEFACQTHGDGLEALDCNVKQTNCLASGCAQDGYGFQWYGESVLTNCESFYCGDDGVSHHRGCKGYVNGGEYSYNGSGGITPAFGALVNISDCLCKNNDYGIGYLVPYYGEKPSCIVSNCACYGNSTDILTEGYDITLINCKYTNKTATSGGSFTEY